LFQRNVAHDGKHVAFHEFCEVEERHVPDSISGLLTRKPRLHELLDGLAFNTIEEFVHAALVTSLHQLQLVTMSIVERAVDRLLDRPPLACARIEVLDAVLVDARLD
jgi:hypothetical protein